MVEHWSCWMGGVLNGPIISLCLFSTARYSWIHPGLLVGRSVIYNKSLRLEFLTNRLHPKETHILKKYMSWWSTWSWCNRVKILPTRDIQFRSNNELSTNAVGKTFLFQYPVDINIALTWNTVSASIWEPTNWLEGNVAIIAGIRTIDPILFAKRVSKSWKFLV